MTERTDIYRQIICLRRRFRPQARPICHMIPPLALANVLLLLFGFFMINSRFILMPGITVNLPVSEFISGTTAESMVVTLSRQGMVFFNDERTTLKGLEQAFVRAAHENRGMPLVIEADEQVRYSAVVEVYNMAVAAGIREVSMATRIAGVATSRLGE